MPSRVGQFQWKNVQLFVKCQSSTILLVEFWSVMAKHRSNTGQMLAATEVGGRGGGVKIYPLSWTRLFSLSEDQSNTGWNRSAPRWNEQVAYHWLPLLGSKEESYWAIQQPRPFKHPPTLACWIQRKKRGWSIWIHFPLELQGFQKLTTLEVQWVWTFHSHQILSLSDAFHHHTLQNTLNRPVNPAFLVWRWSKHLCPPQHWSW